MNDKKKERITKEMHIGGSSFVSNKENDWSVNNEKPTSKFDSFCVNFIVEHDENMFETENLPSIPKSIQVPGEGEKVVHVQIANGQRQSVKCKGVDIIILTTK